MTSLDSRYLEFRDRTAEIFRQFPPMESLRQLIFKTLVVNGSGAAITGWLGHWGRRWLRSCRQQGSLTRADVLLVIEGRRELGPAMVLPVWEACRRRGLQAQLVALNVPLPLPPPACRFDGVDAGPVPDWWQRAWSALSMALPGLDRADLQRAFAIASASAEGRWRHSGDIIETVRPSVVVIAAGSLSGSAALATRARLDGRRTVQLQHGVPQAFYTPVLEDLMLTWGESSNATLQALGVPSAKLRITGSPRHDTMGPIPDARPRLCAALGLPNQPTLVFFSNGNDLVRNGRAPAESVVWLEAAAKTFPQLNVVARLHPNEDGSLYRSASHVRVTRGDADLHTTLGGADIVASVCSTAMYEALLFHKAVWQFSAPDWPPLEDNWKQGLAERIGSCADLQEKLRQWLPTPASDARWARAAGCVFANHGGAALAAGECIAELLAESSRSAGQLVGGA